MKKQLKGLLLLMVIAVSLWALLKDVAWQAGNPGLMPRTAEAVRAFGSNDLPLSGGLERELEIELIDETKKEDPLIELLPPEEVSTPVAEQGVELLAAEARTTRMELESKANSLVRLTGSVMRDGEPLSRCSVGITPADVSSGRSGLFSETDDEGLFEVTLTQGGEYVLFLGTTDQARISQRIMVPSVREHHVEIAFVTGSISGYVYSQTGEPIREMEVLAKGTSHEGADGEVEASAVTNVSGAYVFERLPSMVYSVSVRNGGGGPLPPFRYPYEGRAQVDNVKVGRGESKDGVDLVLSIAAAIYGQVTSSEGQAISGATVRIKRPIFSKYLNVVHWETEGAGLYNIGGLEAGSYFVRASCGNKQSPWTEVTTVLETTQLVNLVLSDNID